MALITSINEIKEVIPRVVVNLDNSSLFSNFNAIEEKYLTPVIGDALYNDLLTKYAANNLSVAELTLVKHIRLMTAAHGLLDDMAANHVFYTSQGIRVHTTGNMQKAVGWEYKEFKVYLQTKTLDGLEVLLKYMWKNKATLALWTNSDEYKKFEGLLIKSGTDFNEQYTLHQPMRTFYRMISILKDAQKEYITSAIGEGLLKYLVTKATPDQKEKDIINELKKGLAFFTIKQACDHLPVQISDAGFTVVSEIMGGDRESDESGRSAADQKRIQRLKEACDRDGRRSIRSGKNLSVAFYKDAASTDFKTAFEAGPLASYINPKDYKSGNEKRKFFRF